MANSLFDYLAWRGDLPMSVAPFNQVDGLILCAFSYIDPPECMIDQFPVSIHDMIEEIQKRPMKERKEHMRKNEDIKLLDVIKDTNRFGSLYIHRFEEIVNTEDDTQFAAYLLSVEKEQYIALYRGTDHTIVGWKEDLNLCYMDSVPCQKNALRFLKEGMTEHEGSFILCGHSKGGNISVYAGTCCEPEENNRILGIYNYDGPGFSEEFMNRDYFVDRISKIHTFIPESSVIGCLLEHKEDCGVVSSKKVGGFSQHDPYSWNVLGGKIIEADRKSSSYIMDQTIKELFHSHTLEQRKNFTISLFGLFEETGSSTFDEMFKPQNLVSVMKSYNQMDEETKELFQSVAAVFGKSLSDAVKETVDTIRAEKTEEKEQKKVKKTKSKAKSKISFALKSN